ncbi:MAG: hypothetical protein AB1424_03030 [Thermodesulfobacteriota bacterium]
MPPPQQGLRTFRVLILLFPLLLPALLAGCPGGGDLSFPTEYQAVFLDNGQVFFGKIGATDSAFLTLRDVYYVQRLVSGEKKEARSILMRLGSEWHGPDFMRINTRHIVRLEPVAPDSQVARLIREAKAAPAAAGPAPGPAVSPPPAAAPEGKPGKGEKKAAPARR